MHALLSSIELRTMNEENKPGAVMEIVESGNGTGKMKNRRRESFDQKDKTGHND